MTMTKLPATCLEADATDAIVHWIDLLAEALKKETNRAVLRNHIKEMIRQGTLPAIRVVEAARDGHEDADRALRDLGKEALEPGQREVLPVTVLAYVQEALDRPPVNYGPGRNLADSWMRDIAFSVMVALAVDRWKVRATRNDASKHPSGCSLVSNALERRGIIVGERQLERIYGNFGRLGQKLSASIPMT
jgi:hypothetical protein